MLWKEPFEANPSKCLFTYFVSQGSHICKQLHRVPEGWLAAKCLLLCSEAKRFRHQYSGMLTFMCPFQGFHDCCPPRYVHG
jgi:hypothetical protein